MLAIGVMSGVGYYFMGLPNYILLAVFAAVAEVIPMVGPVIAAVPDVLVALTMNPLLALVVVIYSVIIQQLENHILVPRVMGKAVGISPLTVLLGILARAALYGLPGTFVSVPIAAAIQVILSNLLRVEPAEQADPEAERAAGRLIHSASGEEVAPARSAANAAATE